MKNIFLSILIIFICSKGHGQATNCKIIEKLVSFNQPSNIFKSSKRDSFLLVDMSKYFSKTCNGWYDERYFKFEYGSSPIKFGMSLGKRLMIITQKDKESFIVRISDNRSFSLVYYFEKNKAEEYDIVKLKAYDL